jgi:putative endonuclease
MSQSWVYILSNRRYGVLYVGMTTDLSGRIAAHKQKLVPGFMNSHGVTQLVYFEAYSSVREAREREQVLKRWRRAWKLKLIDEFNPEWRDLCNEWIV